MSPRWRAAPPRRRAHPEGSAPTEATADDAAHRRPSRSVGAFAPARRWQASTPTTLNVAFDDVHYLPRIVELDPAPPEFTRAVWEYLDSAVSPQRVARGKDKLLQVRDTADTTAARYGVPPGIVVAIWGIESNYGDNFGNTPTIDALATLGFEGRRESWARGQLLAA